MKDISVNSKDAKIVCGWDYTALPVPDFLARFAEGSRAGGGDWTSSGGHDCAQHQFYGTITVIILPTGLLMLYPN